MSSKVSIQPAVGPAVARMVLVAAPILAFGTFSLPGIVTLALVLPLSVMVASYVRSAGPRVPVWEGALIAVLALSVLWSDLPSYSVERLRTYLPLISSTAVACSLVPGEVVIRCLRLAFGVMVGSSLVVLVLDPSSRVREGSSELILHAQFDKNVYGAVLAFAVLLVTSRPRYAHLALMPLLVLLLALDKSVTAWVVATIVAVAALAGRYIVSRQDARVSKAGLATLLATGTGGAALGLLVLSDSALATVGKDPSLGSRTETWAASWHQILNAPLLGHGAYTFLDAASNSPVTRAIWAGSSGYRPPHPHNGLLDLWGQVGIVGVVVFGAMILSALRQSARVVSLRDETARTAALGLGFVLIFGLTEPTYLGPWLVVTLMCVSAIHTRARDADVTEGGRSRPARLSVGPVMATPVRERA